MSVLTSVLELLGLVLVVAGVAVMWWPAALVVAGVGLLWVSRQISGRGTA